MAVISNQYVPDYSIHPGEYLEEVLEAREQQKSDLAARAGLTPKTVSQIIKQRAAFSTETALQFEKILGIPARIWLRMLSDYELFESRAKEKEELEKSIAWTRNFPLADLKRIGVISKHAKGSQIVSEILSFFQVGSIESWNDYYSRKAVAYRKSPTLDASDFSMTTWLQLAEIQARRLDTPPYDEKRIRKAIPELRKLTKDPPDVFEPEIYRLCAECGVAVVLVPELTGTRVSGATEWLSPEKAMVALSLRYKSDDHFWFTLFHELAHVLLHNKKPIYIDSDSQDESEQETEANRFARNVLVPPSEYRHFLERGKFYESDIRAFARKLEIAPGIVVGILQHEGHIDFKWQNGLKRRFEFRAGSGETSL